MNETTCFHLSIPAVDLERTLCWYTRVLGCVAGRRSAQALILDLGGHQLVAQHQPYGPVDRQGGIYPRHFGLVFGSLTQWQALRERTDTSAWFPAMDGSAPLENLVSMAGPLLTPDGCRPGFDSPAGVAAFEFHRELYQRQWILRRVLTEGHRSAVAQFLSGQVAMVATGMQFIGHLRRNNPGLYAQVGVAPQVASARAPPNIAAMNLAVPTASAQPALAFAFAQFVTNADNQLALVRRVPLLPSTRASYDDALFQQPSGDALLDQARAISVRQVFEGAVLVPPLRHYNKLRSSFVRQLQSAMVGRSSAQAAVQEVCRLWTPLLGCRA